MRTTLFLLVPLLLVVAMIPKSKADNAPRRAMIVGGWSPIKDIGDPHVLEIAQFAISEHNMNANCYLTLVKVIKGETQVVAGTNYRLVLEAKGMVKVATYEAVVWEKSWENFKKLTSFKPAA